MSFFTGLKFADFLPTISEGFGKFLSFGMNKSSAEEQFERQKELAELQQKHNQENMRLSQKMSIENALNAGVYERLSKQRAGLNLNEQGGFSPIAGASALSAGQGSAPNAPQMDFGSFAQLMQNAPLVKAQADKAQAEADAIRAKTPVEVDKLGSEVALNRVNARLAGVHADNLPARYTAEINEIIQRMILEQAQTDTEFDKQENIQSDTDVNKAKVGVLESEEDLNREKTNTEKVQQNKLKADIADLYAHVQWLKSDKSLKDEEKAKVIQETGKAMYEKLLGRKNVIYYEDWLENTLKRSHYQNLKDFNDARLTMQQAILAWKNNDWYAWHEAMDILKLSSSQQSQLMKILAK